MEWDNEIHESKPLSDELIDGFEKITGFKLPEDYKQAVKQNPNAYAVKDSLRLNIDGKEWVTSFGVLMTLDPFFKYENVLRSLIQFRKTGEWDENLLPITVGGGGDYICLDYTENRINPKVVYYFHELEFPDCIINVASSFTELLSMLYTEEDC